MAALRDNLLYRCVKPKLSAEGFELFQQFRQDMPNPFIGPGEPFEKNRAEHNAELPELHIGFTGSPVKKDGAEDHVDQKGIGQKGADKLFGRTARFTQTELVVVDQRSDHFAKPVDLGGKFFGNL